MFTLRMYLPYSSDYMGVAILQDQGEEFLFPQAPAHVSQGKDNTMGKLCPKKLVYLKQVKLWVSVGDVRDFSP